MSHVVACGTAEPTHLIGQPNVDLRLKLDMVWGMYLKTVIASLM